MTELSADQVSLIRATMKVPAELASQLGAAGNGGIVLSEEEAGLVLELATERLMTDGFDVDYRPTPLGEALEDLIDRLTAADS